MVGESPATVVRSSVILTNGEKGARNWTWIGKTWVSVAVERSPVPRRKGWSVGWRCESPRSRALTDQRISPDQWSLSGS